MINNLLTSLITVLVKPLSILVGYFVVKRQGAKEAELKGKAEALDEAKKAQRQKLVISRRPDHALANIVFLDDKRRDSDK